jgi:hypothetical protein
MKTIIIFGKKEAAVTDQPKVIGDFSIWLFSASSFAETEKKIIKHNISIDENTLVFYHTGTSFHFLFTEASMLCKKYNKCFEFNSGNKNEHKIYKIIRSTGSLQTDLDEEIIEEVYFEYNK